MKQTKLGKPALKYSYGPYNKIKGDSQAIRITEGCPHNCPYCNEPTEFKIFGIPEIERNHILIYDMNLLAKPQALEIIKELGNKRVNGKVIYYEMVCGIDYRFLTQEIANVLKESRIIKIRIAWDWWFKDQRKIKSAIGMLTKAGYNSKEIMIFMICNWKVPFSENMQKLDLCKIWRVQVSDCYYDNQTFPNVQPEYWKPTELKEFRKKCRKHNQIVNFGIDPEES